MAERALFRCGLSGFNCEACDSYVAKTDRPTMSRKAFAKLRFCSTTCAAATRETDAFARFEMSYEVDERGCWIWLKSRTSSGYGKFWSGERLVRAHRWSYEQAKGPLGSAVCRHKCDTPACVNPDHLKVGTQAENLADAKARGRTAKGERQGNSRLSEADVRAIRGHDGKLAEIAAEFGIARSTASQIRSGQRWRHVT